VRIAPTATRARGLRSVVHADVLHPEMRGEGAGSASGFPPWQSTTRHLLARDGRRPIALKEDFSGMIK